MSENVGRIAESWADEARSAALDARRRAHPDWHWGPTKAESKLGIVHVSYPHSVFGEGPHVADFQSFTADGRRANVNLHLDDSHPAVQDAKGDFPDMGTEHFEFIDQVPVRYVEAHGKNVAALGMQHANEVTARVQAAQRAQVVTDNQRRRASLPDTPASRKAAEARRRELKAGLRSSPW